MEFVGFSNKKTYFCQSEGEQSEGTHSTKPFKGIGFPSMPCKSWLVSTASDFGASW